MGTRKPFVIEFEDNAEVDAIIEDVLKIAMTQALAKEDNYPMVKLALILFRGHWYEEGASDNGLS